MRAFLCSVLVPFLVASQAFSSDLDRLIAPEIKDDAFLEKSNFQKTNK
jgi:hypothetical protein